MSVPYKPEGYHTATPYLILEHAEKTIEFLKQAFDAEEKVRMAGPDGLIMHAEVTIGDSPIMLSQSFGQWKPMPSLIYLYMEDVDKSYQRALDAGATSIREASDQFYGDRSGAVIGPSGCQWWVATHIEDVSPEEMQKRHEDYISDKNLDEM